MKQTDPDRDTPTDEAARIVAEYGAELRRFAATMVGPERADDVVQDTYLRLRRSLDGGARAPDNPKAFAFRVAANLARDELRRSTRHQALDIEAAAQAPREAPSAGEMAALDEQLDRVREAVANLPPKCRRVFVLRRVEQHSYAEIAARMGISEKTVENQVGRALKLIRKFLEEHRH